MLEMRYKNLPDEIIRIMGENNCSLYEIAQRTKLSYQGLDKILKKAKDGTLSYIQESTVRAIKEGLNVDIDEEGNIIEEGSARSADDGQVILDRLEERLVDLQGKVQRDMREILSQIKQLRKEKAQRKNDVNHD